MRRALVVVLDVSCGGVAAVVVPEPLEDLAQFLIGEEEEEHHRVGLLGDLVAVRLVALRPQDPVESLDVPVFRPVRVPVEFCEFIPAFELADDAVLIERNEHPAAHVVP